MSSARSTSAITSLPKPGALTPAGVGRSTPATAGSASLVLARAVAETGGVMTKVLSETLGDSLLHRGCRVWRRHPTGSLSNAHGGLAGSRRGRGSRLVVAGPTGCGTSLWRR